MLDSAPLSFPMKHSPSVQSLRDLISKADLSSGNKDLDSTHGTATTSLSVPQTPSESVASEAEDEKKQSSTLRKTERPQQTSPPSAWDSMTSNFATSYNTILQYSADVGGAIEAVASIPGNIAETIGLPFTGSLRRKEAKVDPTWRSNRHFSFGYEISGKTKLGCTVYFAEAFDNLRQR